MRLRRPRSVLRHPFAVGGAVVLALMLASLGSAAPARHQGTSLRVILGSIVPDVAQGQNYIPVSSGWDAQGGIDVTNNAANGALAAISALQAGQGDVSPSLADNIPVAVNAGGGVISIAQIAYSPSFVVVFPANSKSQTVNAADLKGTTVGIQNLSSASYTLARGIMSQVGLDPDKDTKYASIGQTTQAAQAVSAGQVDWAVFTTAQLAFLDQAGVKYKYVRVPGLSRNYVGQQVAASTKALADPTQRRAIVTWLRNYLRAFKLERYNLPEFVKLYVDATKDTTAQTTMLSELAYNDFDRILPPEAYGRFGYSSAKYWGSLVQYELKAGTITKAPALKDLFTTELLQEANQGTCGAFDTVTVAVDGSIPGPANAELWVGQDQGFFGQESVTLRIVKAGSAKAAIASVLAGKADLALVAQPALAAHSSDLTSVYQSNYGSDNDVFAMKSANVNTDAKKGPVIRALQGYTFARKFCKANPSGCAASYAKRSGDHSGTAAIVAKLKARDLGNPRKLTGFTSGKGSTNALLKTINNQQCYWSSDRPF